MMAATTPATAFSEAQILAIREAVTKNKLAEAVSQLLATMTNSYGPQPDSQKLAELHGRLLGLQITTKDADISTLFKMEDLELILKQKSAAQSFYAAAYKNSSFSQPKITAIEDLFNAAKPLFDAFPEQCTALSLQYPQSSDAFNKLKLIIDALSPLDTGARSGIVVGLKTDGTPITLNNLLSIIQKEMEVLKDPRIARHPTIPELEISLAASLGMLKTATSGADTAKPLDVLVSLTALYSHPTHGKYLRERPAIAQPYVERIKDELNSLLGIPRGTAVSPDPLSFFSDALKNYGKPQHDFHVNFGGGITNKEAKKVVETLHGMNAGLIFNGLDIAVDKTNGNGQLTLIISPSGGGVVDTGLSAALHENISSRFAVTAPLPTVNALVQQSASQLKVVLTPEQLDILHKSASQHMSVATKNRLAQGLPKINFVSNFFRIVAAQIDGDVSGFTTSKRTNVSVSVDGTIEPEDYKNLTNALDIITRYVPADALSEDQSRYITVLRNVIKDFENSPNREHWDDLIIEAGRRSGIGNPGDLTNPKHPVSFVLALAQSLNNLNPAGFTAENKQAVDNLMAVMEMSAGLPKPLPDLPDNMKEYLTDSDQRIRQNYGNLLASHREGFDLLVASWTQKLFQPSADASKLVAGVEVEINRDLGTAYNPRDRDSMVVTISPLALGTQVALQEFIDKEKKSKISPTQKEHSKTAENYPAYIVQMFGEERLQTLIDSRSIRFDKTTGFSIEIKRTEFEAMVDEAASRTRETGYGAKAIVGNILHTLGDESAVATGANAVKGAVGRFQHNNRTAEENLKINATDLATATVAEVSRILKILTKREGNSPGDNHLINIVSENLLGRENANTRTIDVAQITASLAEATKFTVPSVTP